MKAKHPPKVNIWAGIPARGATKVVVFTRTLTATRYVDIFLKLPSFPFWMKFTRMVTDSSRTTTLNIQADMHKITLRISKSTGLRRWHQVQT